jgi:hypothetical protein
MSLPKVSKSSLRKKKKEIKKMLKNQKVNSKGKRSQNLKEKRNKRMTTSKVKVSHKFLVYQLSRR